MPSFPVGRGGIMLNGAAAPAAAIINNGPGLLYLYRNSAVSSYAYDTVIGPSGSFQWPGGELWAASDSSTTVNVLAGLSAFDSGTTQVAGTVSVAGSSSGGSSVAIRGRASGSTGGINQTLNLSIPGLQAGDLIVGLGNSDNPNNYPGGPSGSGWTLISNNNFPGIWQKVATAADVANGISWGPAGNQTTYSALLVALINATQCVIRDRDLTGSKTSLQTGAIAAPLFLLGIGAAAVTFSWGNAADGAPVGARAWETSGQVNVTNATWSTPTTYPAKWTMTGTPNTYHVALGTVS